MLLPPRTKPKSQGVSRIAKKAMNLNEKIQELKAQTLRVRNSSSRAKILKLRFAELTSWSRGAAFHKLTQQTRGDQRTVKTAKSLPWQHRRETPQTPSGQKTAERLKSQHEKSQERTVPSSPAHSYAEKATNPSAQTQELTRRHPRPTCPEAKRRIPSGQSISEPGRILESCHGEPTKQTQAV